MHRIISRFSSDGLITMKTKDIVKLLAVMLNYKLGLRALNWQEFSRYITYLQFYGEDPS